MNIQYKNGDIIETGENSKYRFYYIQKIEGYTWNLKKATLNYKEFILFFKDKEKFIEFIKKEKEKKILGKFIKEIEYTNNKEYKITLVFGVVNIKIGNSNYVHATGDPFYFFGMTKYKNINKFTIYSDIY